jgi:hypothetical protein
MIAKMSQRTKEQITSCTQTCHGHKRDKTRSIIPSNISEDVKLYGLDGGLKQLTASHNFNMHGSLQAIRTQTQL